MATKRDHKWVRAIARALPEVTEGSHRARADLRVRNKIFATLPEDGSVNLKTTPDELDNLIALAPDVFRKVWGERWVGVDLAQVDPEVFERLLRTAWRLAAPKQLARTVEP